MKLFPEGIEISEVDALALKNDLLDLEDWVKKALEGKIFNCKKRMDIHWKPLLDADPNVKTIPANLDERILFIVARDDYEDRQSGDARREEEKQRLLVLEAKV